ncbi:hypothetical protein V6N11_063572 [Hibiscus sabdariffa]|uniref:Uncharacterized protein n=2 Tax=Hibiscus sabdariffa TaxID=183260 RepID=A0ABR2A9B8_9ROSI
MMLMSEYRLDLAVGFHHYSMVVVFEFCLDLELQLMVDLSEYHLDFALDLELHLMMDLSEDHPATTVSKPSKHNHLCSAPCRSSAM